MVASADEQHIAHRVLLRLVLKRNFGLARQSRLICLNRSTRDSAAPRPPGARH